MIVELDNSNIVRAFIRFDEEDHVEYIWCQFRLIDLTQKELHTMRVPAILDDDDDDELQDTTFLGQPYSNNSWKKNN